MYKDPTPATAEFTTPVAAAEALLAKQTAMIDPVLAGTDRISGRKKTIGVNVTWLKSGVDSIDYNGNLSSPGLTCDLGSGQELEGDAQTYNNNRGIVARVDVKDNVGGSQYSFEELSAQAIAKGINDIRKALNAYCVTFINANAQANVDGEVGNIDLGNGPWAENVDGITIEVPKADFRSPDSLAEIDAIIANNNIYGAYFLLNGRHNFYNANYNKDYKGQDDDKRSIRATINDHDMWWDIRVLDQALSGQFTFAINPNAYVIWNASSFPMTAQLVSPKDGMWIFSIEDPILQIMENGRLRPVKYEVVYTLACTGRDENLAPYFTHKYEISFVGGLDMAPPEVDGGTGILRFKGIAGV